ncbi:YfcC family protein, partial [Phocaeicola vulgatus]|nr:YfcC family protein [Phocaeicola vulgatus]
FLLMIIAIIPWGSKFGVHIFEDFHEFLTGIPILGSILGHSIPLGDWFFTEMTMLFLAGAVLIGIVYGFNEKKIVDLF